MGIDPETNKDRIGREGAPPVLTSENRSSGRPIRNPVVRVLVERWEANPRNATGTDKTWVENRFFESRDHFAKAIRIR